MSSAPGTEQELRALAERLGAAASARGVMLATAESCTGGLVAAAITAVSGSSAWFERGFVTYSNRAKVEQLGVDAAIIERFGAVSAETALAMAQGALVASAAQWAVAVTGVAGPTGGTVAKPVGTVCFAWAGPGVATSTLAHLPGDRDGVRRASVRVALQGLIDRLA